MGLEGRAPRLDRAPGAPGGRGRPSRGGVRGPHSANLRDSGGADREGAAQTRPDPRRGRSRVPGPASGDPARACRGEDQREGRAPGGGRHWRPDVAAVPDPVHHHQAGAAGGLGLPVRVRPDDPHEPVVAHRDHAAGGAHSAAAPRQKDGQSVARRELRLLLQAKGPRASGGGQAGIRTGGVEGAGGAGGRRFRLPCHAAHRPDRDAAATPIPRRRARPGPSRPS